MNFVMAHKMFVMRSFVLIFALIFFSCNTEKKQEKKPAFKYTKESIEEVNKLLVDKDTELIESYVTRRNWDMTVSETGLWYMIIEKAGSENIEKGDHITFNYKTRLLDGTLCYSSDSLGVKSIIVGQGGIEAGVEEGILYLKSRSKARFILPPHLAYGLIGDGNRIPARAIIIYDIEILSHKYSVK